MAGWMLYTLWAVLGLMLLHFLISLFRSLVTKSFTLEVVLVYLKDILFYVFPLLVIITLLPLDPTGWILIVFYFISGVAIILNYLIGIINQWRA